MRKKIEGRSHFSQRLCYCCDYLAFFPVKKNRTREKMSKSAREKKWA